MQSRFFLEKYTALAPLPNLIFPIHISATSNLLVFTHIYAIFSQIRGSSIALTDLYASSKLPVVR